jgi:transcriptional regulator with XRE-family HTH domain
MDPSVASPRVNQYERGKHTPDTSTLGKLGQVLNVPVAYFYAEDEDLALLILTFHRASIAARRRVVSSLAKAHR